MVRTFIVGCTLAGLGVTACIKGSDTAASEYHARPRGPIAKLQPSAETTRRPEFVTADTGQAAPLVREASRQANEHDRRLVVYVGAPWCEPCQAFHHAVERGELDDALAGVRFLEFDSDRDGARLTEAGYHGRYIPRFVIPGEDGRGSSQRMEGGIKGDGAVAHLMARLGPLLERTADHTEARLASD